jgi:YNFM family putative membrane transporter
MILAAVENRARDSGCCKITLEVQEHNHKAQRIYEAAGFSRAVYVEAAGGIVLWGALTLLLLPSIMAVVLGLLGICAGFFSIHSAAVGALNRMLASGHGRANALYVLFYYMGGWLGITVCGIAYKRGGWSAVVYICIFLLIIPISAGIGDRKISKHTASV